MSNICPVCQEHQHADQAAFAHHVESHFAQDLLGQAGPSSAKRLSGFQRDAEHVENGNGNDITNSGIDSSATCPSCNFPIGYLSPSDASEHIESCLNNANLGNNTPAGRAPKRQRTVSDETTPTSRESTYETTFDQLNESQISEQRRRDEQASIESGWDGPARPGGWSDWVGKKVSRGDKWWNPVEGVVKASEIPNNFSPGVIPILASALRTSVQRGHTRHAVLSTDIVHIKSVWGFDMGWGCGYRNALMLLSALLLAQPSYRRLFSYDRDGAHPGVRRCQGWIEEAWGEGFDPVGREELKGRVLGSRKWIGAADLYALFTYKGIRCQIYDFPKRKDGEQSTVSPHMALQRWVKAYFSDEVSLEQEQEQKRQSGAESAFDVLMRSSETGRGEAVRMSRKLPLILQHAGHSRTIVGYEETTKGNINLLLFDPGRTMPKDVRQAALASLAASRGKRDKPQPPLPAHAHAAQTYQSPSGAVAQPNRLRRKSSSYLRPTDTHEGRPFSPPFTDGRGNPIHRPHPFGIEADEDDGDEGIEISDRDRDRSEVEHLRGGTASASAVASGSGSGTITTSTSISQHGTGNGDGDTTNLELDLQSDEELTPSGWIRKKFTHLLPPKLTKTKRKERSPAEATSIPTSTAKAQVRVDNERALRYFRVETKSLGRYKEYQVLAFGHEHGHEHGHLDDGVWRVLTEGEREASKFCRSVVVRQ